MKQLDLPFEIVRACRCSFVVRLSNGAQVFVSNQNLLDIINGERNYDVIKKTSRSGIDTAWIVINRPDFGFKPHLVFDDRLNEYK